MDEQQNSTAVTPHGGSGRLLSAEQFHELAEVPAAVKAGGLTDLQGELLIR